LYKTTTESSKQGVYGQGESLGEASKGEYKEAREGETIEANSDNESQETAPFNCEV